MIFAENDGVSTKKPPKTTLNQAFETLRFAQIHIENQVIFFPGWFRKQMIYFGVPACVRVRGSLDVGLRDNMQQVSSFDLYAPT